MQQRVLEQLEPHKRKQMAEDALQSYAAFRNRTESDGDAKYLGIALSVDAEQKTEVEGREVPITRMSAGERQMYLEEEVRKARQRSDQALEEAARQTVFTPLEASQVLASKTIDSESKRSLLPLCYDVSSFEHSRTATLHKANKHAKAALLEGKVSAGLAAFMAECEKDNELRKMSADISKFSLFSIPRRAAQAAESKVEEKPVDKPLEEQSEERWRELEWGSVTDMLKQKMQGVQKRQAQIDRSKRKGDEAVEEAQQRQCLGINSQQTERERIEEKYKNDLHTNTTLSERSLFSLKQDCRQAAAGRKTEHRELDTETKLKNMLAPFNINIDRALRH